MAVARKYLRMSAVPVQKPIIVSRPRPNLRVEQGGRVSVATKVGARMMQFGMATLVFFMCSSMAGQVMVEKARREGLSAASRAKEATKAEALLRTQIQDMSSTSAIDQWALAHGFQASEVLANQLKEKGDVKEAH